ncbi:MAG: DUF5011 domain-containing protein [Bacteroidota bacterium]|nr:DUF5011 domain-containing protein [Bacteroidota bacterium]
MKSYIIFLIVIVASLFSCEQPEIPTKIIPPVIVLNGNKIDTAYLNSSYDDRGAIIEKSGNASVNVTGSVNTALSGIYYVDYDYTDTSGNTAATVTRTVHVVENKCAFLNGGYDVVCTCIAIVTGAPNATITTTNYTANVAGAMDNNSFELSSMKIGSGYVVPFPAPSINGNSITVNFWDRDCIPGSCSTTGTLSVTKNTFTIESLAYQFSPAVRYRCKNVYTKQL